MKASRRSFLGQIGGVSAAALAARWQSEPRPNILWLIAEDFCPDLGCYGNTEVRSPNIDRLASEGMRFTNAFATCPVCSPSRSAFMTGMYQTSIDAHNHRSHRDDGHQLPDGVRVITEWFRQAGYFTANVKTAAPGVEGTGKTDFNFSPSQPIFDGTDWNQRKAGQPFFAQINFSETHRVFKRNEKSPTDPAKLTIPPQYPDHPITRADWAAYYDTIGFLDEKIGKVLKRLADEQLLDKTIIFFFADNGRAHVRAKQWLYDEGIHIPLIIRWPDGRSAGQVNDQLVSAIDFGATSLNLAGIPLPPKMQGRPFLGPGASRREYIVAARDRCDETVDRIRCVRDTRFKYIRNFYPERPYSQLNRYKETQYPVMRLMRRLHAEGKLTPAQAKFMTDSRPAEELYDLTKDPHELENLAGSAEFQEELVRLRGILDRWIADTGDRGTVPEDPSIPLYWEREAKANYNERLRRIYSEEGMEFPPDW
ncbi:MAG TPA: sulfatase [Acidobacteriota bacterium]|nr:sulfatase [Acidobacteriota bacterium]